MKIRTGHVSNSSSASFTLPLSAVTNEQLDLIRRHREVADERWPGKFSTGDWYYKWRIYEGDRITFESSMDNFDMLDFLVRIGVTEKVTDYYEEG